MHGCSFRYADARFRFSVEVVIFALSLNFPGFRCQMHACSFGAEETRGVRLGLASCKLVCVRSA
eukprot:8865322-Pyramimonas_sp.AAC.1